MNREEEDRIIREATSSEYKEGFVTDVEQDYVPKGLSEEIIRTISALKEEPEWLLEFRLDAFPLGRDLFEPVCIRDNVFLHGTDFCVQVRYFILPSQIHMNDGGLGIAVRSADKFVGSFCQQFQGMDDQPLQDKHVDKDRKDG